MAIALLLAALLARRGGGYVQAGEGTALGDRVKACCPTQKATWRCAVTAGNLATAP